MEFQDLINGIVLIFVLRLMINLLLKRVSLKAMKKFMLLICDLINLIMGADLEPERTKSLNYTDLP